MEGEYRMKVNLTPILHICAQSHLKRVKKNPLLYNYLLPYVIGFTQPFLHSYA